jgi:hypothetical protein
MPVSRDQGSNARRDQREGPDSVFPWEPAERPWLAMGISRRRAKAREQAAMAAREAVLERLAWQAEELQASLERCAAAHAVMAMELSP